MVHAHSIRSTHSNSITVLVTDDGVRLTSLSCMKHWQSDGSCLVLPEASAQTMLHALELTAQAIRRRICATPAALSTRVERRQLFRSNLCK